MAKTAPTSTVSQLQRRTADAIKTAREARGLSQAALAERVGTSQQTVDRIEKAQTVYSRFLDPILDHLGLTRAPGSTLHRVGTGDALEFRIDSSGLAASGADLYELLTNKTDAERIITLCQLAHTYLKVAIGRELKLLSADELGEILTERRDLVEYKRRLSLAYGLQILGEKDRAILVLLWAMAGTVRSETTLTFEDEFLRDMALEVLGLSPSPMAPDANAATIRTSFLFLLSTILHVLTSGSLATMMALQADITLLTQQAEDEEVSS